MAHSRKPKTIRPTRTNERGESGFDFLVRELPPGTTKEASYFANALSEAGARYDRYTKRRNDWIRYAHRKKRLQHVAELADKLASVLYQLDIMSFDDLTVRIDPKKIETLVGSLLFLSKESRDLAIEVQDKGKPRELAEERWIFELADIYENAFGRPASVSGSGSESDEGEPTNRRGKFYRLLEVSRPRIVSSARQAEP
jgi:hypothetical protein